MSATDLETKSITTDYINLSQKYRTIYGPKTIVLLQCGVFFEVYGLKINQEITDKTPIIEFAQIANLNIADKKIYVGEYQVVMSGFRDYSLEKYLQKITENGYTAVVFVQEKVGKVINRVFHSVHSAGTYISYETDISPQITNNIMCIWLESFTPLSTSVIKTRNTIVCGVAVANIFTGQSAIFEYQTAFYMNPTTFDELERFATIYSPSEIIIISPFSQDLVNTILLYSGIQTTVIHYVSTATDQISEKTKNCSQPKYIQHILSTFYDNEIYNICAEFVAYSLATQSFCYLLNFIQEHNPDLIRKIAIPAFNNSANRVILANHTLKQLNIIDDRSIDGQSCGHLSSVLAFLNRCCSPMGKRLFQSQLLNPSFDQEWLESEYCMTAQILKPDTYAMVAPIRKQLGQIRDIEKICRQLIIRKVYPSSIYHLYKSIKQIQQINVCLYENCDICDYLCSNLSKILDKDNIIIESLTKNEMIESVCSKIILYIESILHIDICKTITSVQTFDVNIIQMGFSSGLDNIYAKYQENVNMFNNIHQYFNKLMQDADGGSADVEYVKIHETEKLGSSLQITKKRGLLLKTILGKMDKECNKDGTKESCIYGISIDDIKLVHSTAAIDEVSFPLLERICKSILKYKDELNVEIANAYNKFLGNLEKEWFIDLENLAKYVARLDVLQCKAYIAKEYNYCRPEIVSTTNKSFVSATELRHCLIEHLNIAEIYVPNDIMVGSAGSAKPINGILLYGTNAVGKTSLIRALGIAVIMAQSGIYVPCSKFVYKPYTAIFSRILGNDNIFKGLSTFAVEMSELRLILKMADENSLVLGDELCSGTETESALSIFMAGLLDLRKKQSSYIFATHFHEILKYSEMAELPDLCVMHMAVTYNREKDSLIYDRKLREGAGNRMYGLEVCKSLYLPDEFLEKAYQIRNKYHPESGGGGLSNVSTTYNAKKIRGICEMCKENMGEEIHHIAPQKSANSAGFIGTFHKNHPANLMSVCGKCHDLIHSAKN